MILALKVGLQNDGDIVAVIDLQLKDNRLQ